MKVYMISGKARNGKDTLAGFMKRYFDENGKKACIMHIGNYIKVTMGDCNFFRRSVEYKII